MGTCAIFDLSHNENDLGIPNFRAWHCNGQAGTRSAPFWSTAIANVPTRKNTVAQSRPSPGMDEHMWTHRSPTKRKAKQGKLQSAAWCIGPKPPPLCDTRPSTRSSPDGAGELGDAAPPPRKERSSPYPATTPMSLPLRLLLLLGDTTCRSALREAQTRRKQRIENETSISGALQASARIQVLSGRFTCSVLREQNPQRLRLWIDAIRCGSTHQLLRTDHGSGGPGVMELWGFWHGHEGPRSAGEYSCRFKAQKDNPHETLSFRGCSLKRLCGAPASVCWIQHGDKRNERG